MAAGFSSPASHGAARGTLSHDTGNSKSGSKRPAILGHNYTLRQKARLAGKSPKFHGCNGKTEETHRTKWGIFQLMFDNRVIIGDLWGYSSFGYIPIWL